MKKSKSTSVAAAPCSVVKKIMPITVIVVGLLFFAPVFFALLGLPNIATIIVGTINPIFLPVLLVVFGIGWLLERK